MYKEIDYCRISKSTHLIPILDLGAQYLTGVFPKSNNTEITKGPIQVVWCPTSGLVQLKHSYDIEEMYGDGYGYRSGLNSSMADHLRRKVRYLERTYEPTFSDLIIDIGSNDGTLLNAYSVTGLRRIGIDPSADRFESFYDEDIDLISDFFSSDILRAHGAKGKAKIITSIAMFYDLEDPNRFVADVADTLAPNGIWHFEQSYLPSMLRTTSYDTICHEHLEYYSLRVIKNLLEMHSLRIIDVQMNGVNGGSFAVTACHTSAEYPSNVATIAWLLGQEDRMNLDTPKPYRDFESRVFAHRTDLRSLIHSLRASGKRIAGYGASTKGNVMLQFCNFSSNEIESIGEINPDKFGKVTPGSNIPILPESEVKAGMPDYMLVLPWHFRESIIRNEQTYLESGGKLIFPLPEIEIV